MSFMFTGQPVVIPVLGEDDWIPPPVNDATYNYNTSLLRCGLDFLELDRLICAGDADQLSVMMRRLIPTFISLTSYRSKYAIEAVNFLTKTELLLSEYESARVRLQSFVNTKGMPNHNKPTDMQQENNIKLVKTVIRGLGAGKSDKAMVRISKAAPVVADVCTKLQEELGIFTHKIKWPTQQVKC
jgi:hypothetical protein